MNATAPTPKPRVPRIYVCPRYDVESCAAVVSDGDAPRLACIRHAETLRLARLDVVVDPLPLEA